MNVRIDREKNPTHSSFETFHFADVTDVREYRGMFRNEYCMMEVTGTKCPDANFRPEIDSAGNPNVQQICVYTGDTVIYYKDGISYWNTVKNRIDAKTLANEMSFLLDLEKVDEI